MKVQLLAMIGVIIILMGCSQATPSGNPEWVDELISKFESEAVGNPPQSIWRYEYNGQSVYYIPAQCCDMYSSLYDTSGNIICAPDGGISGKGDGLCMDFLTKRSNEQLIWKDIRIR